MLSAQPGLGWCVPLSAIPDRYNVTNTLVIGKDTDPGTVQEIREAVNQHKEVSHTESVGFIEHRAVGVVVAHSGSPSR